MSGQKLLEREEAATEKIVTDANVPEALLKTAEKQMMPPEVVVNKKINKIPSGRNYGIELLRILSMLFIIMLHVINFGGAFYYNSGVYFPVNEDIFMKYKVMNIMLAFFMCAVNCYALISGYVSCKSKFRISKVIILWLTVVAVNGMMYGLSYLYNPEWVAGYDVELIYTPLSSEQYWYFTAYLGLMIIMPALNAAVNNLPKKQFGGMLIGMFVFFSLFPCYTEEDIFLTHTGYSMLWLVFMYLTGAYFKLHFSTEKKIPFFKTICGAVYVISCLAMAFYRFGAEEAEFVKTGVYFPLSEHYIYTSPFVVIASVSLFLMFVNINIKEGIFAKIISFVSSSTFGVYLVHLNSLVVTYIITGRFVEQAQKTYIEMALSIVYAGIVLFVISMAFEKVRQLLFKILFIDKLISLLDKIKLPQKRK